MRYYTFLCIFSVLICSSCTAQKKVPSQHDLFFSSSKHPFQNFKVIAGALLSIGAAAGISYLISKYYSTNSNASSTGITLPSNPEIAKQLENEAYSRTLSKINNQPGNEILLEFGGERAKTLRRVNPELFFTTMQTVETFIHHNLNIKDTEVRSTIGKMVVRLLDRIETDKITTSESLLKMVADENRRYNTAYEVAYETATQNSTKDIKLESIDVEHPLFKIKPNNSPNIFRILNNASESGISDQEDIEKAVALSKKITAYQQEVPEPTSKITLDIESYRASAAIYKSFEDKYKSAEKSDISYIIDTNISIKNASKSVMHSLRKSK